MIKTVQVQYSRSSAGRAAYRLHKAFSQHGIDSSVISLKPDAHPEENIIYLPKRSKLWARLDQKLQAFLLRKNNHQFGYFSYPLLGTDIANLKEIKEADIIYLHWVLGGFFNLKSIKKLAKLGKPVVIYMHDMWPVTGGCHYSFNCIKYLSGCYDCQFFQSAKKNDWSRKEFLKKMKLYEAFDNLYFVSPSNWLSECAKLSLLAKNKPVYHIPNVLDDKLFKKIDKKAARALLRIEPENAVIAFGALSLNSPYKGWSYLQEALQILKTVYNNKPITTLIFGSSENQDIEQAIPFKCRFVGFLEDEYSTALVYNAADVFVAPSLADNSPYTIFEALACGTAVVGFNTGGIPDFIRHKQNGYLTEYRSAEDIARGIAFCLDNKIEGFLPSAMQPGESIKKHLAFIEALKSRA